MHLAWLRRGGLALVLVASLAVLGPPMSAAANPAEGSDRPFAPDYNVQPGDYAFLSGKKIVIDPGHGGQETGAIGFAGSLEKNNTLATAFIVKDYLEKYGAGVTLTRTEDSIYNEPLRENLLGRAALANALAADVFVSIHNDWMPKDTYVGTSTWYWRDDSKGLADVVQYNLLKYLQTPNRKVQKAPFVVVKETLMPAVLVELAFLSNPDEERALGDPAFQTKAAEGITAALARYFALQARLPAKATPPAPVPAGPPEQAATPATAPAAPSTNPLPVTSSVRPSTP